MLWGFWGQNLEANIWGSPDQGWQTHIIWNALISFEFAFQVRYKNVVTGMTVCWRVTSTKDVQTQTSGSSDGFAFTRSHFCFYHSCFSQEMWNVSTSVWTYFFTKMLIWDSWEGYELLLMLMLLLRQDDIHIWIIFYLFRSCWTHFDPIFNLIHKSGRGRDEWKLWNSAKDKVFPVFHKPFEQLDMRWFQKLGKVGRRRRRTLTSDRRLVEIMNLESNWNIKLYGYKFLWLKLQKHEINICSPVRSPGLIFTEPLPHQTSLAALAGLA